MNKKEFLKRCETIYDMGLVDIEVFSLMGKWTDAILRYEGRQLDAWERFVEDEKKRTHTFSPEKTLANDVLGYKIIQLSAILSHHCQICAEDTNAWHTRPAFCEHLIKLN